MQRKTAKHEIAQEVRSALLNPGDANHGTCDTMSLKTCCSYDDLVRLKQFLLC